MFKNVGCRNMRIWWIFEIVGYLLGTCWIAKDTKGYHFFISQDSGEICVVFKKISILKNRLQKKDPVFSRLYFLGVRKNFLYLFFSQKIPKDSKGYQIIRKNIKGYQRIPKDTIFLFLGIRGKSVMCFWYHFFIPPDLGKICVVCSKNSRFSKIGIKKKDPVFSRLYFLGCEKNFCIYFFSQRILKNLGI